MLEDHYCPPDSPESHLLAKAWGCALPLLEQRLMMQQEAAKEASK